MRNIRTLPLTFTKVPANASLRDVHAARAFIKVCEEVEDASLTPKDGKTGAKLARAIYAYFEECAK